jgi:hypothetical protein
MISATILSGMYHVPDIVQSTSLTLSHLIPLSHLSEVGCDINLTLKFMRVLSPKNKNDCYSCMHSFIHIFPFTY